MRRVNGTGRHVGSIILTAVALLLAGALVAGCGSDKKDQFNKAFKPVNDDLLALGGAVGQAMGTADRTPDTVLAGEFLGFASRLHGIKGRLDALDPPGDLKSQSRTLSVAVGHLEVDLRGIGTAARTRQPAAARAATVALLRDSQATGDARRTLARKTGAKAGA